MTGLALVITDEQHRFGVGQREALGNKGSEHDPELTPHVLVMSATHPTPGLWRSFCMEIWIFLLLMRCRQSVCLSKTVW